SQGSSPPSAARAIAPGCAIADSPAHTVRSHTRLRRRSTLTMPPPACESGGAARSAPASARRCPAYWPGRSAQSGTSIALRLPPPPDGTLLQRSPALALPVRHRTCRPELRGSGRPRPDRSSIARLRIASHRGASRRALWQPPTQPSHSVPAQLFRSKIVLGMFSQLIADNRKRLRVALAVSLALHGGFIALMLRRPAPRFLSPVFLMAGNGGAALQTIYLDQLGRDDVVAPRTAR